MNTFSEQEQQCALQIYEAAKLATRTYAGQQDHKAATAALLVESLILAGGQILLKPTEE
jgi:hypothetical protein